LLIGDHWLVKICDFGMARVKSLGVTMTKLGTLQWVAPEVLRDERYSEKADIYSFAILVWELIASMIVTCLTEMIQT
jgi:serine/threonine protein kinase